MFSPTLISAWTLSIAMMCGVESTFTSPDVASALIARPNAGIDKPMACASGIVGPRTPSARLVSESWFASGLIESCALKPRSEMAPSDGKFGTPPWKLMPNVFVRRTETSMMTASMKTCLRCASSCSITRRSAA